MVSHLVSKLFVFFAILNKAALKILYCSLAIFWKKYIFKNIYYLKIYFLFTKYISHISNYGMVESEYVTS